MQSYLLIWTLVTIVVVESFLIVYLLKRGLTKSVLDSHIVNKSKATFDESYQVRQIDIWTKSYFNNHHHSKKEIGKMYERYIGYLKEQEGYSVEYHGIHFKHKDSGIDLICKKENEVLLVQCKRLSHFKNIHKDILNKLRGSLEEYKSKNVGMNVRAEVCASAPFAEDAVNAANIHNIKISVIPFDSEYPSIKCNISNGHKSIFPVFHPLYDRILITPRSGERYCKTAEEAYKRGFRPVRIRWVYLYNVKRKVGLIARNK